MAPNVWWYFWSETLPNWLMALAALGAGVVFIWRRQERREKATEELSEILLGVQAKWVKLTEAADDDRARWGVLVENQLKAPILDVKIICSGNSRSTNGVIRTRRLPRENQVFIESRSGAADSVWGFPEPLQAHHRIEEIASRKHTVNSMTFTYRGKEYVHDGIGNMVTPEC